MTDREGPAVQQMESERLERPGLLHFVMWLDGHEDRVSAVP